MDHRPALASHVHRLRQVKKLVKKENITLYYTCFRPIPWTFECTLHTLQTTFYIGLKDKLL